MTSHERLDGARIELFSEVNETGIGEIDLLIAIFSHHAPNES